MRTLTNVSALLSARTGRLLRAFHRRGTRLVRGPARAAIVPELWREALFFGAGRFKETLEAQWPSGRYVVATADYDVSRRTYVSGPYGLDRLLRAAALVEHQTGRAIAGSEVLEIGANIGTTTVPLVTVLRAARVHAFEPIPRNYALLERNVRRNGLSDAVALHEAAVSDHVGRVALTVPERFWGSSRVSSEARPEHTAPAVTIDRLLADGTLDPARLALVWIDVEGHEAAVLAGATTLGPVPIVVEYLPQLHADLDNFHRLLAGRAVELFDLATGSRVTLSQLASATDLLLTP